jgi:hypothetical protein
VVSFDSGQEQVLRATTIGHKRILKLTGAPVRALLLRVTQSRAAPLVTLSAY